MLRARRERPRHRRAADERDELATPQLDLPLQSWSTAFSACHERQAIQQENHDPPPREGYVVEFRAFFRADGYDNS